MTSDSTPTTPKTHGLSAGQLSAIADQVQKAMAPLLDGVWKPAEDIPAGIKVALYLGSAFALTGFGVERLAHAWLMSQGLG